MDDEGPSYEDAGVIDEVDEIEEDYEAEEGDITEEGVEKEEEFEEDELIDDDDIHEYDLGQYKEILTEVKVLKVGKNPYKTGNFLYKYELTRIVSSRAAAIQHGAPPLISLVDPKNPTRMLRDPLEIAENELDRKSNV